MTDQRRQIEVEALLQWAYRDELPKKYMSSAEGIWATIEELGHNGGVDVGHGAAQRYPHYGLPHPDAIAIERAVSSLPDYPLDWQSEAADLLGPLIALIMPWCGPGRPVQRFSVASWQYGATKVRQRLAPPRGVLGPVVSPAALVTMHAKMGTRPDWFNDWPKPEKVLADRGGQPKLIGKFRRGEGKIPIYEDGSYNLIEWCPSPITIAQDRADYVAWYRGLRYLASTLNLVGHIVLPPTAPEFPWRDREHAPVIINLARPHMSRLPLHPQRPTMGPPLRQPKAGKGKNVQAS
jgi:hypothetical protein